MLPTPPGYAAPAINRQGIQLLGGQRGAPGISPTNTLGGGLPPGMMPGAGQLTNKPNIQQIIQALMTRGGAR